VLSLLWLLVYDLENELEMKFCLFQKMLLFNPGDRISAKASLLHPYFDDLDKTTLPAATGGKSF
jgi:serine/threonine protein kinase